MEAKDGMNDSSWDSASAAAIEAVAEAEAADMVALGDERTIEQDPSFAIRILVDVANLALSPAVNDPTTAVQVLDYLGETLRLIGTTDELPAKTVAPTTKKGKAGR